MLAEIEQRTESALRPGTSVYRALDKTVIDNRSLVAALRAVLDLHRDAVPCDCGDCDTTVRCASCFQTWPCSTTRAITDALNGVTAGTDR